MLYAHIWNLPHHHPTTRILDVLMIFEFKLYQKINPTEMLKVLFSFSYIYCLYKLVYLIYTFKYYTVFYNW